MCIPHNQENEPLSLYTWTLEQILRTGRISTSSGIAPDFCGHSSHRWKMLCVVCNKLATRLVHSALLIWELVGETGNMAASRQLWKMLIVLTDADVCPFKNIYLQIAKRLLSPCTSMLNSSSKYFKSNTYFVR